jgi:hypothetical protein
MSTRLREEGFDRSFMPTSSSSNAGGSRHTTHSSASFDVHSFRNASSSFSSLRRVLRREEPIVVEVQQVVDLAVRWAPGDSAHVHSEVLHEDVTNEAVPASAGGELVESLHDEEGQLFLEEEQVIVHVLHRPHRVHQHVIHDLLGLEEELHQEAPNQEQRLRLQQGQCGRQVQGWARTGKQIQERV